MVMAGEDIPRKLSGMTKFDCYPGVDESDDEESEMDVMGQSFDIQSGKDFKVVINILTVHTLTLYYRKLNHVSLCTFQI
jgi:hypothetical protein